MQPQRQHGRRRAIPAASSRRRPFFQEPTFRLRGQQLGVAAAVTGVIALTAFSTAQADAGERASSRQPTVVAALPAEAAVSASPGSVLTFDRPEVSSQAAPVEASGSVEASSAAPVPSAAAPSVASTGLRAPLSSMQVSSPFGFRISPITGAAGELHTGIDLSAACSTAVKAAGSGTVAEAGWDPYGGGNRIVVDHGNGLKTTYNHLANIDASVGQVLSQGQQIAGVGTTGASTGCHLHFEVIVNGQTADPASFI